MTEIQSQIYEVFVEFDRVCKKLDLKYSLAFGTLLGAVRHEGFIPWDDDIDVIMERGAYEAFLKEAPKHFNPKFFLQTNATDPEYFFPFAKIRNDEIIIKEQATAHLDINHGVWIDIFPYDNVPDDKALQDEQFMMVQKYTNLLNFFLFMYVTGHERKVVQIFKKFLIFVNKNTYKFNFMLKSWFNKREKWLVKYKDDKTKYATLQAFRFKDKQKYYDRFIDLESFKTFVDLKFEDGSYPSFSAYDTILTDVYGDYMKLPPIEEQKSVHTFIK